MQRIAQWALRWSLAPSTDPTHEAIAYAFRLCGIDAFNANDPQFDIARTGKLHEVLDHASAVLKRDHPLRTVADVSRLLKG